VLVIFRFESFLHGLSQTLAVGLAFRVVKEHIGLMALTATVHMKKNGTAIFIVLAVLLVKLIDFGATLPETCHLVQGYGSSHARLTFAVGKVLVITDSVFSILDNDTDFRPLLHQVTGKAQSHIIRILIFMQFYFADSADSSGVGASMPAHYIKTSALQTVGCHFYTGKRFPEQRFIDCLLPIANRL